MSSEGDTDASRDAVLTAGAARADITPETGRSFQGYVRPDIRAEGVATRLFARALVLNDGDRKVALVSADLLFGIDKSEVLSRVRSLGFTRESVLYAGTHTHAATDAGNWTAAQVADAVRRADANRKPAVAGWGTATVEDVNQNRAPEAHLANHGKDLAPGEGSPDLDPCGPDHPRETKVRVLRVDATDGEPIAAWSGFPVHPTAFTPHNTVYSADLVGAAVRHFSARVSDRSLDSEEVEKSPVVVFGNGVEGDLIPLYDDHSQHALADSLGERLADGMVAAWQEAAESLSPDISVSGYGKTVEYEGQEVEPGKRVSSKARFGLPFLGGGKNGPSLFYGLGLEGRRKPAWLSGEVHGRKIKFAPAPWGPEVEVQVVRLGDRLLLAVPGEPTVEMGRRTREAVADVVPDGITDVAVVGLANGYNGYFTTPEEYDRQHYEGGHTVFGKHTEALVRQTHVELASLVGESDTEGEPTEEDTETKGETPTETEVDAPVGAQTDGELLQEPTGPAERMSVVEVEWSGGPEGRDRPVGDPFVRLERTTDEGWVTVATDLGLGFVWVVDDGRYTARHELSRDAETGQYRLRVTAEGYDLRTEPFEVVPRTGLRVRGAELEDDNEDASRLILRAQNPPPDTDVHLRTRPVRPCGGKVEFEVGGESYEATWSPDTKGWTTKVDNIDKGDVLTVESLRDGAGNRSENPKEIRVGEGEVSEVTWPPDMEVGGGKPPGPFGIGTWPI